MNQLDTYNAMRRKQTPIIESDTSSEALRQLRQSNDASEVAIAKMLAERQQTQSAPTTESSITNSQVNQSYPKQAMSSLNGVPVTQQFGNKNPGLEKYSGGVNLGTDFGVKKGTPLALPPGEWEVVKTFADATEGNRGANYGSGNLVKVLNRNTGEYLTFEHLDKVATQPGQILAGGTVIGLSGNTGNSTGPHASIPYQTPDGKYHDVLSSPYAQYLFGRTSGTSNGKGGGVKDFVNNVKTGVQNYLSQYLQDIKDPNSDVSKLNRELYNPVNVGLISSPLTSIDPYKLARAATTLNSFDRNLMGKFGELVEMRGNKTNLGQTGADAAKTIDVLNREYGLNIPVEATNLKIKNIFDKLVQLQDLQRGIK